jgi:hypothetical protein
LVGVKTAKKLKVDFVDVEYGNPTDTNNTCKYTISNMIRSKEKKSGV